MRRAPGVRGADAGAGTVRLLPGGSPRQLPRRRAVQRRRSAVSPLRVLPSTPMVRATVVDVGMGRKFRTAVSVWIKMSPFFLSLLAQLGSLDLKVLRTSL